jgi:hypothetical protein
MDNSMVKVFKLILRALKEKGNGFKEKELNELMKLIINN